MNTLLRTMPCLVGLLMLTACPSSTTKTDPVGPQQAGALVYPETKREDIKETLHGQDVQDPYRWLEDASKPDVKQWMTRQDTFTRQYLGKLPKRDALAKRFAELFYVDAVSAPRRKGDRFFWWRRKANQEKYVIYWKEGEKGKEQVLLDPNAMSKDGSISVGNFYPSHDGKYVAYTIKANNADEATLYVMEVATGKKSDVDVIEGAKYAWPSWMPDNSGFYYTSLPTDKKIPIKDRPGYAQVRFHKLGTSPKNDPVVVPKTGDPKMFIGAGVSRDGKYLFSFKWKGWNANDVFIHTITDEASRTKPNFKPLVENIPAKFSVEVFKDDLYILTNHKAPNYRVLKTSMSNPSLENAKEIIPEQKDNVIQSMDIIGGKLVLMSMKKVNNNIRVHDLDGKVVRDVQLPTVGATFGITGNPDKDEAYFSFMSFTVPRQIYKTSISTGKTDLWAKVNIPIDPSPYKVEQVFFSSKDGTKVPMFIISRKDIKLDGSTPFILNGYGGFNVSLKPYFRASIYPWLEAGGGYAVANLRGGGEFGEQWHQDGMMHKKQNVFDDFIAAAKYLQDKKYTSPKRLAISGGSNGGLLVGAAMTQRPELFGAVICAVPLLDMVRYHLFGSGKTWIPEYGSADDAKQFKTLVAYSPYHNIKPKADYPATLFMSADSDDRVDPLHARKMAAALQNATGGKAPILLRIEENAGHGGGDMVKKSIQSSVDTYSFLMCQLGMTKCP